MRAKRLLKNSVIIAPKGMPDYEISGISCNSKSTQEGFIFVAIKGNRVDGNVYIKEAISRGAKIIVTDAPKNTVRNSKQTTFIKVADARKTLAQLASEFYERPAEKIKIIGVTGTNGKTTITYLIEAIIKEAKLMPAVVGTINYRFKDKIFASGNTTPGPLDLQSMFAKMSSKGVNYCVMEVSSHALDQGRVEGIKFDSAIFTNLTQDHLDYHENLENYFKAKAKLFKVLSNRSSAIINIDDKYAKKLIPITKAKIVTYGISNKAQVFARDIKSDIHGTEFTVSSKEPDTNIRTSLIGKHNVYNILAAFSWAQNAGIDLKIIQSAINKFKLVPGRLEKVDCKCDFSIFVDYAHTDDALKNVIQSLRNISKNRIIVVFGCGGERDKKKRPKMGRVVSELSDYAVITNDNPRTEDPEKIIEDILKGIKRSNFCVIPERMSAIRKSLTLARQGDIVLVAGKGHENYQIINGKTLHFDDKEAVKECLKSLN